MKEKTGLVNELTEKYQAAKIQMEGLNGALANVEGELKEKSQALKQSRKEIENYQMKIKELQLEAGRKGDELISSSETKISSLTEEIRLLKSKNASHESNVQNLEKSLETYSPRRELDR